MSTRPRISCNADSLCNAFMWGEEKKLLCWKAGQDELITLLKNHRAYEGKFDCLVPVSGGKDGSHAAEFRYR